MRHAPTAETLHGWFDASLPSALTVDPVVGVHGPLPVGRLLP